MSLADNFEDLLIRIENDAAALNAARDTCNETIEEIEDRLVKCSIGLPAPVVVDCGAAGNWSIGWGRVPDEKGYCFVVQYNGCATAMPLLKAPSAVRIAALANMREILSAIAAQIYEATRRIEAING